MVIVYDLEGNPVAVVGDAEAEKRLSDLEARLTALEALVTSIADATGKLRKLLGV